MSRKGGALDMPATSSSHASDVGDVERRAPPSTQEILAPHFAAVVTALRGHDPKVDIELAERAYRVAQRAHAEQKRKSGEPYLIHPLRVAATIARLGLGPASVAAALMHDSVEDSELTIYEVTEQFGREVANLVDGVTKLGKVPYLSRRENQAESFRKMLLAMSQDIRVLLVKLADRLDNMQTLQHMPAEKQRRIARETMDIYAPLAGRLGIDWIRNALADLAFGYLEPVTYAGTQARIDALTQAAPNFVDDMLERLHTAFADTAGPEATGADAAPWKEDRFGPVELRATMRTVFKVHNFELQADREVDHVSDLVSYQIVTRDRVSAYAALGRVHAAFKPVPGRFRDYVALPRPNRYQALHTTVVDKSGTRLEIQLRSERMDAVAERGVAVELGKGGAPDTMRFDWLDELLDWEDEVEDPNEFIEAVKAELFADEVYAFTPEGELHTFPAGATPIDFAFAVHSDVGLHCAGARVNGHVVPLRYRLRQGDTVEIMTSPQAAPKSDWVKIARSSRARAKIKHYLRSRERERLRMTGEKLLDRAKSGTRARLEALEDEALHAVLDPLGVARDRGALGVLEEVGGGGLAAQDVLEALGEARRAGPVRADESLVSRVLRRMAGRSRGEAVRVGPDAGRRDAPIEITRELLEAHGGIITLSECCGPVPGDPVVGYLSHSGIRAHVQNCPGVQREVEGRRVYLQWGDVDIVAPIEIKVKTMNSVGLLAEMSRVFSSLGVNIKQANCRALDAQDRAMNTFHASVRSLEQIQGLERALRRIPGVMDVQRVLDRSPNPV